MELEKNYDPAKIEDRNYKKWMERGYFHAEVNPDKKPYTIVIPPPNITGHLHMGHALDNTLQDILIRFKRMQGYEALWQPGTDHASIATEVKITEALLAEGTSKEELGREKFLVRAWQWKDEYGGRIISQLKKLGSSCDWDRTRFTMDEGCSKAVEKVFLDLYRKGYIYRGSRIINWCPLCHTTISDAEVEYQEQDSFLWHLLYPVKDSDIKIEVATSRPETMLGDTAVAVNPNDERYKDLIGKTVILPLMNREIPVVADEYVDTEFGTGAVKVTPAHDPNDFELGKRHSLPEINIMNDDGTINENGGRYAGMDRYDARKAIIEDLADLGLYNGAEKHVHNVGTHDRCKTTIEPLIKKQWFVAMEDLARPAIEALKTGDLKFVPERYGRTYLHWLENIRDWCISRQLWWGHRIPAYYCADCGEIIVAGEDEKPDKCPVCGSTALTQDEDSLDTWFSSALWPFSTLGWPEKTPELEYFYPTDTLVTGYDIIFFWVIRMVFSGIEHTGKCPFNTVLIHGLVRDALGRKMSKSLGNGIDPLEVIEQYGADALRLTLVTGNAPGNDMRFSEEKILASRNFANKVWNASRFILMNFDQYAAEGHDLKALKNDGLTSSDKWILSKANTLVRDVTENMEKFELGIAVSKIYSFIWEEFCDWYIEMVKPRLYNSEDTTKEAALWTLRNVLITALKLLHPYMPFITEEIFMNLQDEEETIMLSSWPEYDAGWEFAEDEAAVEKIKEAVKAVRDIRAEKNVPLSKKVSVSIAAKDDASADIYSGFANIFTGLSRANELNVTTGTSGAPEGCVSRVLENGVLYIPLNELVDLEEERARLQNEEARLLKEIARAEGMLSNERFVAKAPEAKVNEEKEKLEKYRKMLESVKKELENVQ
ncbi:MAG: valine--tRNA ligase [Lachnospiraceae bacterium]|nr:valine--tRNA ligase [Lachnospiraceae bacterium]